MHADVRVSMSVLVIVSYCVGTKARNEERRIEQVGESHPRPEEIAWLGGIGGGGGD